MHYHVKDPFHSSDSFCDFLNFAIKHFFHIRPAGIL